MFPQTRSFLFKLALPGLLLASGGALILISTNIVSSSATRTYHWQPSSSSGTTWATGWNEFVFDISNNLSAINGFASLWNGLGLQKRLSVSGGIRLGTSIWDGIPFAIDLFWLDTRHFLEGIRASISRIITVPPGFTRQLCLPVVAVGTIHQLGLTQLATSSWEL